MGTVKEEYFDAPSDILEHFGVSKEEFPLLHACIDEVGVIVSLVDEKFKQSVYEGNGLPIGIYDWEDIPEKFKELLKEANLSRYIIECIARNMVSGKEWEEELITRIVD